jgi:Tfp pilus assembly protein PilF
MIRTCPRLWVAAIALLLMCLFAPAGAADDPRKESICDATADHFLAAENYAEAIRHRESLRKDPSDALAHYHLGFALGMVGDKRQELSEYLRAAALGLSRGDLFVNMGVSLLENGNLKAAMNALQHAVELDPSQPESHFNLGLVYERRNILTEAEQEMRVTLLLEPGQLDARNMLGVIYARKGNAARASVEWRDLLQDAPNYSPARANLMMVVGKQAVSGGDTEALLRPSLRQTPPGPARATLSTHP